MNPSQTPTLSNAIEGVVFAASEQAWTIDADKNAFEVSCVNLVSKMENWLAKAREMEADDFVDASTEVAQNMLSLLSEFSREQFKGDVAQQVNEEIERARTVALAFSEVLKTRTLGNALLRTFWAVEECDNIKISHAQLGAAINRVCTVTCYHSVAMIDLDSDFGKEIDQSTVEFVNELKQFWG